MNQLQLSRAAILGAALALCGTTSHAQLAPNETPLIDAAPGIKTVDIKLRNAPVSFVAYWLDPLRQTVPLQLQQSRRSSGYSLRNTADLPRQPGNGNGPRDLKMPAGIESILAVAPQNVLRIRGAASAIEELKKLLVELDVPLRQIEVEAQFCELSQRALKELPLEFVSNEHTPYAASVSLVPPTIIADLNRLIAANEVRVITAPRITAIDGLTAQIMTTESIPMVMAPQIGKLKDQLDVRKQWAPGISFVEVETGLTCTPVLQGDLIKLFTRSTLNDRSVNVNATLRDGETIAIAMPADKSDAASRTVIFLTARIVRRAGDEIARAPESGTTKLGMIR